jgi:flagellar hook-length control protein FliK
MQVNFSSNLSNSAAEASAKGSEISAAGAADGFLAQMGHILNQDETQGGICGEETPSPAADSGSNCQNDAKSRNAGEWTSPQAPNGKKTLARDLYGLLSGAFPLSDECGSTPLDASYSLRIIGESNGTEPLSDAESTPVRIKEGKRIETIPVASAQDPVVPAPAADGSPPVIILDFSAHLEDILRSQNSAGDGPSILREGKTIDEADSGAPVGGLKATNSTYMPAETQISTPGDPNSGTGRNPEGLELQNANIAQRQSDADLSMGVSADDSRIIANSMQQSGSQQKASPIMPQSDFQSLPDQVNAGDEIAMQEARQGRGQNAQSNLDFLTGENSEITRRIPERFQQISGRWENDPANEASARGLPEEENVISPARVLAGPLKAAPAPAMSTDTADSSAGQEQTEYAPGSRPTAQGKPELGQLDLLRREYSAVERQSPVQTALLSDAGRSAEAKPPAGGPTEQSSTARTPDMVFQLAEQMRIQVRDGKGEICIQLKPESLGSLEIKAENTINGVSARISTESHAVKSYLESNLQVLQQALQDQGLKIERIQVTVQDAFDSQSSSGFSAQFGHTGSGQQGKESQFLSGKGESSSANLPDDAVLDPASWLALNPNNRFYTIA